MPDERAAQHCRRTDPGGNPLLTVRPFEAPEPSVVASAGGVTYPRSGAIDVIRPGDLASPLTACVRCMIWRPDGLRPRRIGCRAFSRRA